MNELIEKLWDFRAVIKEIDKLDIRKDKLDRMLSYFSDQISFINLLIEEQRSFLHSLDKNINIENTISNMKKLDDVVDEYAYSDSMLRGSIEDLNEKCIELKKK